MTGIRLPLLVSAALWAVAAVLAATPVMAQDNTVMITRNTAVCDRTEQVRDAIMAAVPEVTDCADVTDAHLAAIARLSLRSGSIMALAAGDFAGLTSLVWLWLDENRLTSLPEGVFAGLTSLETLWLCKNQLTSLPDSVFVGLTSLRTLYLNSNRLTSLPEGVFAGLTSLKWLWLNKNQLTSLPDGIFAGLTSLERLLLSENQLTSLPEGVFAGLTSLKRLVLDRNRLTSLPEGVFAGLTSLEELWLSKNQLTSLPDSVFAGLTSLRTLGMTQNRLTSLPDGIFAGLATLEQLVLYRNQLSSLSADVFAGLTSLEALVLHGNRLTSLPDGIFAGLATLEWLVLYDNRLTSLPDGVFAGLVSLEALNLRWHTTAPLPLVVTLEKVGESRFKAVAPTGAPFDFVLPVSAANGSIEGDSTAIRIPTGAVESESLGVTRAAGTTAAVTVDIDSLLGLPSDHSGYALQKSESLPLEVVPKVLKTAGTLTLNLDAIAGDDTVNIAEKAAGFTISGDTGSEAGVSVSVAIGSTTLTAASADVSGTATWSVSVPPDASYITGASVSVSVSASKTGFTSPSTVTRTLAVNLAAPSVSYTVPASLQVGAAVSAVTPSTTDTDISSYGATGLPSGLSIDGATGAIGGTPDTADADTASAAVTVTDTAGNTDTVAIAFPMVAKGDQTLSGFRYSSSTVTFSATAPTVTAPGGVETTLSYSATPSTVCTVSSSTGALTLAGVGECVVTVTAASTDHYNEATATFAVTVQSAGTLVLNLNAVAGDDAVNIAEKAAGFTISGDTGSEAGVTVSVTIGSQSPLTATTDNNGDWSVSIPPAASYITGEDVDVTVSASKTGFTPPSTKEFKLSVFLIAPTAPTYTAPASLRVGEAITAMSPSDGSGVRRHTATGLPSGLSIHWRTGVIDGTPDTADANTAEATVTVSDIADNTDTVSITFPLVAKGDQTLAGFRYSSSTVTFGATAPTVTAPGGVETTLSYSATPSTVCTVSSSTGALTLVGVGSCDIEAKAASTGDYNEATATFTVTISANDAPANGLTASFKNLPATHDGSSEFTFQVEFSEDVGISYAVLRDDGFTVTGGDVTGARRVNGRNDLWEINVDPDGQGDVSITLPGNRACGTTGAVCTRGENPQALSNSPSAMVAGPTVAATPTVGISDAGGTEGDDSAIAFTVTLDSAASATVTVDYATANGTADGDDYTATSGTLTFAAGTTSGTITVPIADDDVNESDETFTVTLSNASGATLGTASATGTIRNRHVTPVVSISDAGGTEGDGDIAFTVTLDSAASATVTVDYATADGTVDAGDDYTATSGTLTFAAGTTSGTIIVPIADDDENEGDETFTVTLSNASGATLGTASATGTIRDTEDAADLSADFPESAFASKRHTGPDDRPQVVVAFSEAVAEFAANTPSASVKGASGLSVQPHTEDGLENAYIFFMTPDGDGDVTFALTRNAACAAGGICTAGGTMLAQVPAAWTIPGPGGGPGSLSVADAEATEEGDGAMAFVVTLDPAARDTVTVDYATSDGSAQAGDDYTATSGTLTFDAGTTSGTITVPIAADDENESDETFTVTLSNASGATLGTASATGTIRNRYVTPLTASFEQVPAEHDGTTFVFHVRFSEDPAVSYLVLKEESFDVTGGEVVGARRRDGRDDLREIHVEPSGNGDVTVSLPPPTDCNADGAICTADGRPLSNANSVTVRGMAALSVADAQTTEGAGATLEFAVTLSRAASGTVTVGYATSDGTAVAGSDYTSASGTLTFDPGETAGTVSVTVLDDSVDDGGETLTLTLSNPSGARIEDAEATGTINNADPVPLAWLVRFGRAASDHAVEAIGTRFEDDGGDAFGFGGNGLGGNAPGGMNPGLNGGMRTGMDGGIGMGAGMSGGPKPGMHAGMSAGNGMNAGTNGGAAYGPPGAGSYRPALRDLLIGSSFLVSAAGANEAGASRRLTAWGRAAATRFDGVADGVSVDGDVATFLVGADAAWNRWLAGISVAHTLGAGGFRGADGADGELDSALTAVHPYLRYRLSDRISAWSVLGYGGGDLTLKTDGSAWETDTSMRMAAAGLRGVLLSTDAGLELAAGTDVRFTHIASGEAVGNAGLLGETAGGTSRVRLLLEGSRPFAFGSTRLLTPTLQLGVRRDGGDAETGAGFDLGGSLRYADAALGLTVGAAGRYLLAQEDAAYKEWGASVSVRVDPGASGHGLTLSVAPSWGAAAAGGAQRLWSVRDARGLAGHGFDTAMRLRAEVGYGLSAFRGRGAAMPFAGLSTTAFGRDWRAGARWTRGQALEMSLEAVRRESAGAEPEHGFEFRLSWRPGARGPARGAADRLAEAAGDPTAPTAMEAR